MKNKIDHRRLSRTSEHRHALFRDLVTALVRHERIRTTLAKAKEIKHRADRVITWAKEGTHQYHVKAHGYLRTPDVVNKLFTVLAPRYTQRPGGYTRILRAGYRRGDRAEMAIIEYVDRPGEMRPARPPPAKPVVAEEAKPETLEVKAARLVERQKQVLAAAAKAPVPKQLLPAFPRPSVRPLKLEDMGLIPEWAKARERAQAKVTAAHQRRKERLGIVDGDKPIDVVLKEEAKMQ